MRQRRKPGPKAPSELQKVVLESIELEEGEELPRMSEQSQQHKMRARHCQPGKQHYLIMNPHSVRHTCTLVCRTCNDKDACDDIAEQEKKPEDFKPLSEAEQALLVHVDSLPIAGKLRPYVHNMRPFLTCGNVLKAVSVDVLIFANVIKADILAYKSGLLVFLDGRQHRPNKPYNKKHIKVDREASAAAAEQHFRVLRISWKDANIKMQLLDQALVHRNTSSINYTKITSNNK